MAEIENTTSRKMQMIERLKAKRPELDIEDEEAVYAAISDDYDENDKFRSESEDANRRVLDVLEKDNKAGQFFIDMVNGKDPLVAMIEEYGPDFRVALDDPEKAEELAEANRKHQQRVLDSKKLDEEAASNLQNSLDELDAAQAEAEASDETISKVLELYAQIANDAIVNKIDKATWLMLIKAVSYDADVADAEHIGEVRGKNTKIDEHKHKATQTQAMPPALGGQQGGAPTRGRGIREFGAFSGVSTPSMMERGGMKRIKK